MLKKKNVPITAGLLDTLSQEMRFAFMTAQIDNMTEATFFRLAATVNMISVAAELKGGFESETRVIDGMVRVLQGMLERALKADDWKMTRAEQATVLAGINVCEAVIPRLNVGLLEEALRRVAAMNAIPEDPVSTASE